MGEPARADNDRPILSVPEYTYLRDCEHEYNFYFEKYSPENADYEEMKTIATDLIETNLSLYSESNNVEYPLKHSFYVWCTSNLDNIDVLMDLRLIALMDEWGDHREVDNVEWFIMYKHKPF